jgi:hypothetical protein
MPVTGSLLISIVSSMEPLRELLRDEFLDETILWAFDVDSTLSISFWVNFMGQGSEGASILLIFQQT